MIMLIVMSMVTFLLFFAARRPGALRVRQELLAAAERTDAQGAGLRQAGVVQWTDFLQGVVKGRDYPDDPELRKKAPELVAHCPAPCLGYSV